MATNRMTLSLRSYREPAQTDGLPLPVDNQPRLTRRRSWIGTSTFEVGPGYVQDSLDLDLFELKTQQTGVTSSSSGPTTLVIEQD